MIKKFLLAIVLVVLSCVGYAQHNTNDYIEGENGVRLEFFSINGCPESVAGCGRGVSVSKVAYYDEKCLLVDDYFIGFVKINGNFVKLEIQNSTDENIVKYKGGGYELEMTLDKFIKSGYESGMYEVTLRLFKNNEKLVEVKKCFMLQGC